MKNIECGEKKRDWGEKRSFASPLSLLVFDWFVLFFSSVFDRWGTSVVEWLGHNT